MAVLNKIKRAVRGEVKLTIVALEVLRRSFVSLRRRRERAHLDLEEPLSLLPPFAQMSATQLRDHFQGQRDAKFIEGFNAEETLALQRELFPDQTASLIEAANRIVTSHCWPLLGFGEQSFGPEVKWRRDPLSMYLWPLEYHRDISLLREDGSDARVVWELNRLGHFITLARAYSLTKDERYIMEALTQLLSWITQNPYGRGVNWNCGMEVALRAMNLLAAFETFRKSEKLDSEWLGIFLRVMQQHGRYVRRNLEFSYLSTSNHYLSDVVGLLWLGLLLPELSDARAWREFGLDQLLREMDKQVLADGADFESSTGYHRFAVELFFYSFLLCRANGVEVPDKYWRKLHEMLVYLRAYLRPDGLAPLLGDTDSGQALPIERRRAGDHAYLATLGAVVFKDEGLKTDHEIPAELLWLLGPEGVRSFQRMSCLPQESKAFPQAGVYVLRAGDLYLCLNASDAGINGRGSHGHNDALSIEISTDGRAFVVDPGTYVYTADLEKRHLFRSTAYHSTVRIDRLEQSTIDPRSPFVIGDEAHPRVLEWETGPDQDRVVAEHYGYSKLSAPVTHRRSVTFDKRERSWLIDDEFIGEGEHVYETRFHFAPDVEVRVSGTAVEAIAGNARLLISLSGGVVEPVLETQETSGDYGEVQESITACWRVSGRIKALNWKISSGAAAQVAEQR